VTAIVPYVSPEDEPDPPGAGWLAKRAELPSVERVVRTIRWWLTRGSLHLLALALKTPYLALRELRPISRGLGRVTHAWVMWCSAKTHGQGLKDATDATQKGIEKYESRKEGRRRLTFLILLLLLGLGLWAYFTRPQALILAGLVLVGVLDAVGRRGLDRDPVVVFPTTALTADAPLSMLRSELQRVLEIDGFDPVTTTVGMPIPIKNGWKVPYHAGAPIEDDNLRQIERSLQWRRNGVTQVRDAANAALGELWISLTDPLAEVIDSPETAPKTIYDLLGLGMCANGAEWVESFLRAHFLLVGASRSGKSSLFWQIIYVLRKCAEVELDSIDLTNGPCFSACRRAFRKRAVDEKGAKEILTDAIKLIKERVAELSRLAEDDDTPDEFDENFQPTREQPQRVILIDEGARVTENKELLPLVEYILRYGAKAAVVLGFASQGGGNDDFGSSIVRGQIMLKIMMACSRMDVLSVFGKDARDAGYRPDLLEPAQGDEVRDAGKAFVQSAASATPEMRRAYRLTQADVRRRDRELGVRIDVGIIEATELPTILVDVEQAFAAADNPDRMPTAELLSRLGEYGHELDGRQLATLLRPLKLTPGNERWRPSPGAEPVRGYYLDDIQSTLRRYG
jgi:hypothetical protein